VKDRIENEVVKTGELERNVKLGWGGIREIEFVAQSLQLLHAGRQPFLQGAQTLLASPNSSSMSGFLDKIPAPSQKPTSFSGMSSTDCKWRIISRPIPFPLQRRPRDAWRSSWVCRTLKSFGPCSNPIPKAFEVYSLPC
jgi:hypothetical protein